jgi:hypothetical protein
MNGEDAKKKVNSALTGVEELLVKHPQEFLAWSKGCLKSVNLKLHWNQKLYSAENQRLSK